MSDNKLGVFIATCSLLLAGVAGAAERPTTFVQRIEVKGNHQVSTSKILRVVGLKPGEGYDPERIAPGLKRLFETRQFRDVRALREDGSTADSVVVMIEVDEFPRVEDVRFEGNKHVGDDELKKAIAVSKGTFVRPSLLEKDRDAIAEIYHNKGYAAVAVGDTVITESKPRQHVLVYRVTEGQKVKIKHVDFVGSSGLDPSEIQHAMKTKPGSWLKGGDYNPKELAADHDRVVDLYKSRGYLDVVVSEPELEFSPDRKDLDVYITISEGKRYFVGKIDWTGNSMFPDSTVADRVTLRRGEPFNDIALSQIQFNIANLFGDRGYIYATVTPVKKVHGDVIDLTFEIEQGHLAHVRQINIIGNTKTWEEVIRRQLVLYPGDVFASGRLRRSLREVFNLGFFAGPPEVSVDPVNDAGDIDITLRVQEKSAGQFRVGAGFSQINSISGFIGITEPNFLGRAYAVSFNWEFSRTRQDLNLGFTQPWAFGSPTQIGVQVYAANQDKVEQQFYSDRRTGFSLQVGRPLPFLDYTNISWRYSLERVQLSDFSPLYLGPLRTEQWPQTTSSVGLTLYRNSTDNPFHPTMGTRTTLNARWTGGALGGDVNIQHYDAQFSWFQSLLWKFVLEMRQNVGVVDGLNNSGQVPDYERFRLGGNRQWGLRGYDFYEVVPKGNSPFVGGRFYTTTVTQIEFPVVPPTVYARTFIDLGGTWNSFSGAELGQVKRGAGFGILIELPMIGLFGFDYAYGFDRVGGGRWEPHITFGSSF